MGLIEKFYEIQSKQYAVVQLMQKVYFDFKIYHSNTDVKSSLLKINDCFTFCNITNNLILVPKDDIKEKVMLIRSGINPKTAFFVTKIVVKHN